MNPGKPQAHSIYLLGGETVTWRHILFSVIVLGTACATSTNSTQPVCPRFGVQSVHWNVSVQANLVVDRCASSGGAVRAVTVWHGVTRSVPRNAADSGQSEAHRNALRLLTSDALKGYTPGGMSSVGGAWYLAVSQAGEVVVAYTDAEARPHILSRHVLPTRDSVIVVFLEHRSADAPRILGTETVEGPIVLPSTDNIRDRTQALRAMLSSLLEQTAPGRNVPAR